MENQQEIQNQIYNSHSIPKKFDNIYNFQKTDDCCCTQNAIPKQINKF